MGKANQYNYGVVLDAGSSGTRVYIYQWLKNSLAIAADEGAGISPQHLPMIETKDNKKVHPGVSTYGATPELVGTEHLKPLIEYALDHVPKAAVANTPIFLLATAGMRLLPDQQRNNVLKSICSYLQTETNFLLPDCDLHIQIIPGETEGLYGWIAANYLLGGFDAPQKHSHGKGHHTYGFLDMGGASAQIAFAPNATEAAKHANDLTLLRLRTIDGLPQEYKVFVTTWLGFGVNEARKKYVKVLLDAYESSSTVALPDPCLPSGLAMASTGEVVAITDTEGLSHIHLIGTGRFDECLRQTLPLLEKDKPCLDEPCLINGQHVPAIDFDVNHFIGISEYWHTTHEIFEMSHKDKAYDFNTYQERVRDFCQQDWKVIEDGIADKLWGKKVDEQTAYEVCFKASWLINILHDGIGIPRVDIEGTTDNGHNGTKELLDSGKDKGFLDPFQAVNKIKSTEVSWTLGKMVLYASASVPSEDIEALPVGFGSNVPGIPADFQFPGGGRLQPGSDEVYSPADQSLTDKITDTLFQSDAPHRIPGFIFFMLIIIIAIFYLCGRERRSRFYSSAFGTSDPAGGLASKSRPQSSLLSHLNRLLGRRGAGVTYDRVLEEGDQRLYYPNDFELGAMDSDDDVESTGQSNSKAGSGWNSPTTRRGKPITTPLGRLSPDVIDRRGLVVRTESRERLDLGGRKSRNGSISPTRSKR